jgi:stage II sporulation protein D
VRVAVAKGKESVLWKVRGDYDLRAFGTGELLGPPFQGADGVLNMSPHTSGILLNGRKTGLFGLRVIPQQERNLWIDGRKMRGHFTVIREQDLTLTVINEVGVEDYLAGVMHGELPKGWPSAVLEAQAIAARTFALYREIERAEQEFALTSDVNSQVYEGKSKETRLANRAVLKTQGRVLAWQGKIFPAFYHAACGGGTQPAGNLWKISVPPLSGRPCQYCLSSPFGEWNFSLGLAELGWALRNKGNLKLQGAVTAWETAEEAPNRRIAKIRFQGSDGKWVEVVAEELRRILTPTRLRSGVFELRKEGDRIFFTGHGWGHGVGMCQWGAYALARRGATAEEIIAYYYPSAQIVDWRQVLVNGAWGVESDGQTQAELVAAD